MATAVIFPGQGAQKPGMGAPWHGQPAWSLVERAERVLDEPVGWLLLTAPATALSRTREAQLAVFLASLLAWEAVKDTLAPPVAFAGHSLGQLTALVASGVLDVEQGVRLVAQRAEVTQRAADQRPGRMTALLGADPELAEQACAAAPEACWLANDNAPGQVVIGGTAEGVSAASDTARSLGAKRAVPLDVNGAFHTPLMAEAMTAFSAPLHATRFASPAAPVVANTDATAHDTADVWTLGLAEHLVKPVRWRRSVTTMAELGVDEFVEVGPGNVLSGLVRRCLPDAAVRNVSSPADIALATGARS